MVFVEDEDCALGCEVFLVDLVRRGALSSRDRKPPGDACCDRVRILTDCRLRATVGLVEAQSGRRKGSLSDLPNRGAPSSRTTEVHR